MKIEFQWNQHSRTDIFLPNKNPANNFPLCVLDQKVKDSHLMLQVRQEETVPATALIADMSVLQSNKRSVLGTKTIFWTPSEKRRVTVSKMWEIKHSTPLTKKDSITG